MKILIDHPSPFSLAHGGVQIQIEQSKAALEAVGVEVEFLRWWDTEQTGDLIHFFSVPRLSYLEQANLRRIPVVATVFLSETCNRPDWKLALQGAVTNLVLSQPFGGGIKAQLSWTAYRLCRRLVVGLEAERTVLIKAFGVDPARISIVPLGLSNDFLNAGCGKRTENHLISTGTINAVKRSAELARLARAAQVPILFVGKPYHPDDAYWHEFESLVDNQYVKYHSHVHNTAEIIRLYQSARGFVLFSRFENWSLAASEACACGLPLLLPDRKWSRERFGDKVRYFADGNDLITVLQQFYRDCSSLSAPPIKPWSWEEIALQLQAIYGDLLKASR